MSNLRRIYHTVRSMPVLGTVAGVLRNLYRSPVLERRRLRRRDVREARDTARELFGEEGAAFVDTFVHSPLFQKSFSYGNSGDFDVLMLYAAVRALRPETVLETGVASGRSSSVILLALSENQKGMLYSIDLPQEYEGVGPSQKVNADGHDELAGFLPKGREPGWLVPDNLRERWRLILGDSNVELPSLLSRLEQVDIFYHDGDHSFETMAFEFAIVWPRIPQGGLLFSDDIDWNDAWKGFADSIRHTYRHTYRHFGIVQKQ